MDEFDQALGIDLGLRSGASVVCTFMPGTLQVCRIDSIVTTERHKRGRTQLNPTFCADRSAQLLHGLKNLPQVPIGLDWSMWEAFQGDRRSATWKSFLAGYIYHATLVKGGLPIFIPPNQVREFLGVPKNCAKERCHTAGERYIAIPALRKWKALSEHEKDAVLLAITSYQFIQGGTSRACGTRASRLPARPS